MSYQVLVDWIGLVQQNWNHMGPTLTKARRDVGGLGRATPRRLSK